MKTMNTIGAVLVMMAIAAVSVAPAAVAAEDSGSVEVVNTETVQIYVNPDGEVESQSVYEQLSFTGDGSITVDNPIEESGLRNLDGFSGVAAEDGVQQVEVEVDGYERLRSVSDFTGELPLEFSIQYLLDGEEIEASDVVGATGALEVIYTVTNVTSQPQEISFPDGSGGTMTETVDVPIPIVGSMTTTVPSSFTDVTSEQANIAGDGKGATKLSFTMTLFPPLGSNEMQFSYQAQVSDAILPATSVTALPVNPLEVPTFKAAGESYQNGADTGIRLAEGATTIDTNLLKLRDGAGTLLAGLIKLSDGSDQLAAGLAGEAAPGAKLLADGAGELSAGLGQIDDGAGQLADGADKLAGGAADASSGSQKLEDGLQLISGGLTQLNGVEGLPKALQGAKDLKAGVDEIITKVGSADAPGTLLWGINQLATKLPAAEAGSAQILGGLRVLKGEVPAQSPGLIGAKGGVDQVQVGLADAVRPGGSLDQLIGGLESLKGFCDVDEPACVPTIDALKAGANTSKTNLTAANGGLLQVSAGLGNAIGALDTQLIPGATQLNAGLTEATNGAVTLDNNGPALRAGLLQVQGGLAQLVVGLTTAVTGVEQLAVGAGDAYSGSGDLADGLGLIAAGSGELSTGANKLADGTDDAAAGSTRLADGAGDLADGLGDAADGSERLADGLAKAEAGVPQLVDGADRLSKEGTSQLVVAGEETAQEYGKLYATIAAGAERADAEKMAYGAPESAQGLTAYSYELLGDDGQGSRNMQRGLAAVALLGLGAGGFFLRRRMI